MQSEMAGVARAFADAVIRQWVPAFSGTLHWDGRGLVVTSREHGWGVVVPPRHEEADAGADLAERTPAMVGAVGAVAALTAATVTHRAPWEAPVVMEADALRGALPTAPPQESLGFLALRRGWVGLAAVGDDQHRLVNSLLDDGLRRRTPGGAAAALQSFGIAAMPAQPVDPREMTTATRGEMRTRPSPNLPQVLRGVRVADLGRLVAAPFAGELLARLGAEVSSIRPPGCGGRWGVGEEVDLRRRDGRARARAIVKGADVFVENCSHRAGVRLAELLGTSLPRHVVAIRGFRATSPCAGWRVLGFLAEAALGVGPAPVSNTERRWVPAPAEPVWDRVAGTVAAAAIVSRLGGHSGSNRAPTSYDAVPLIELAAVLATSRAEYARAA